MIYLRILNIILVLAKIIRWVIVRIFSSISDPVCEILDFDQRINGDDRGLINAWNVGRNLALRNPDLVRRMMDGELPVLGVKGGVREKIQADKIGSLWYLAQRQGLLGEDLDIDMSAEVEMVCSRTGVRILYTLDLEKLFSSYEGD